MIVGKIAINKDQAQARAIQTIIESSSKESLDWFKMNLKEIDELITEHAKQGFFGLLHKLGNYLDENLLQMADLLIVTLKRQGFEVTPEINDGSTGAESYYLQISWG